MSERLEVDERLARLLGPGTAEVTCEQCFELLDAFVEQQVAGGPADLAFPGMRAHLAGCPACGEEHDTLVELVRGADELT